MHRAHDSIAALEHSEGTFGHGRQDGRRQRQHSENRDEPSNHIPPSHATHSGKSMQSRAQFGRMAAAYLTDTTLNRYRKRMAQSFLLFDFGTNEELAQQARHTVDRWKQGFRLDKKLLLKFDRGEAPANEEASSAKARPKKRANSEAGKIQLVIRLDFSEHERLSHQRWLDRIPSEAPFKDTQSKIIRQNDDEFAGTAERFEELP